MPQVIRKNNNSEPPQKVLDLLRRGGSSNPEEALAAQREMAQAVDVPLRKQNLAGSILGNIFTSEKFELGQSIEYPVDLLAPGMEKEFVAYAVPGHGKLPQRFLSGDYIMVPVYRVGNAINWPLRFLRAARWAVYARLMEIYEAGYVKKDNNDGFATLLTAAANRNIVVVDANAGNGRLTLKLITLMQQEMRRQAGGNSASLVQAQLTDLYMSIEALEDMRSWTLADVSEGVRDNIANSAKGYVGRLYDTNLHSLYEFGVGQEFQNFYTNDLGGAMGSGDVEILLGLDLGDNSSFVNPVREPLKTYVDDLLFREDLGGVYGRKEHGFAVLDNRKVLLGSL